MMENSSDKAQETEESLSDTNNSHVQYQYSQQIINSQANDPELSTNNDNPYADGNEEANLAFPIRYRDDFQPKSFYSSSSTGNISSMSSFNTNSMTTAASISAATAEVVKHLSSSTPIPPYNQLVAAYTNTHNHGMTQFEPLNTNSSPLAHTPPNEMEDEVFQLIPVICYHDSQPTLLKVNRTITGRDICRALEKRLTLTREDGKFYSLVCIITIIDSQKRSKVYCIRTITNDEIVLNILDLLIQKLMLRYSIIDYQRLKNSTRWFYKDVRSPPILLEDNYQNFETIGEDESSDDEEELSHSDLNYLVKSERKGYLLKRSAKDINLWKKWYCVLTDHLWCIDINRTIPKTICIRLNGVQRSRGNATGEQLHNIIINSTKGTHLLRAFTIADQKKWIEDLHQRAIFSTDNDFFNMAEVIICDEEISKNRRFHRTLHDFLDAPCILQAIGQDYFQFYSVDENPPICATPTHLLSPRERRRSSQRKENGVTGEKADETAKEEEAEEEAAMESLKREGDDDYDVDDARQNSDDDEIDGVNDITINGNGDVLRHREATMNPEEITEEEQEDIFRDVGEGEDQKGEEELQEDEVISVLKLLNPLDRTVTSYMIHQLHTQFHNYYNIFKFLLEVLQYRELYRIDLFTTMKAQRIIALNIFINYLIPQISNDLHKEQIVYKVIALPEKMKRNGINHVNYLFYKSNNLPIPNDENSLLGSIGGSSSGSGISGISKKQNSNRTTAGGTVSVSPNTRSGLSNGETKLSTSSPASLPPIPPSIAQPAGTTASKSNSSTNLATLNKEGSVSPSNSPVQPNISSSSSTPISRFPVYNAVVQQYRKRKQSNAEDKKATENKGGSTTSNRRRSSAYFNRENSPKRNLLALRRESSSSNSYANQFYWGISEEKIMKVFMKLFPPETSNPTNSPMERSPNPSNQSPDELLNAPTRASSIRNFYQRTPSSPSIIASTSSTASNNSTATAAAATNSGWSWWWGGGGGNTAAATTSAKPPVIQPPATPGSVRPIYEDQYTPTPNAFTNTPQENAFNMSNAAINGDLFDEIVEEIAQILKRQEVID